jgi:hypothetical protein
MPRTIAVSPKKQYSTLDEWNADNICPATGSSKRLVHYWLLSAANACRRFGLTEDQAIDFLDRHSSRGQKTPTEFSDTVSKAYETEASGQGSPVRPKWPAVNLELVEQIVSEADGFATADLRALSPIEFKDGLPHCAEVVECLLGCNDDTLICVGSRKDSFRTDSFASIKESLRRLQFIVPSPMSARTWVKPDGQVSSKGTENTGPRRNVVLDFDIAKLDKNGNPTEWASLIDRWETAGITVKDATASIINHLGKQGPLMAVVDSGGKSLHAWFHCLGEPEGAHSRLRKFFEYAVSLGADKATWTTSQFVRVPDGLRDSGNRQAVIYFDPSADQKRAEHLNQEKESMSSSTKESPLPREREAGHTAAHVNNNGEGVNERTRVSDEGMELIQESLEGEREFLKASRPRIFGRDKKNGEANLIGHMPDYLWEVLKEEVEITQDMASRFSEYVRKLSITLIRPKSKSWDDLEEEELPVLKTILDGILNQGAKMTVGGASKAGKTWILMDLAFSIATGREWLGIKAYKGKVFYANLEIQEQFFKQRGGSIKHAKGIPAKERIPNLHVWTLRGHFMTAKGFKDAILEEIGDEKYDVIIVDPLYKILNGADANAAGDMQQILSELEQVAYRADAALVYADHFSKGNQSGKNSIDRISGSGVNARDPDVIATFTEHDEDECLTLEFTLRNFPPVSPVVVGKADNGFLIEKRADLDPLDLKAAGPGKKFCGKQLLDVLSDDGMTGEDWFSAVREVTKMSAKTYENLRKDLRNSKKVYLAPRGKTWQKTSSCIEEEAKMRG